MIAGLLRYTPLNPSGDTLVGRRLPDDYRTLLRLSPSIRSIRSRTQATRVSRTACASGRSTTVRLPAGP